MPGHESAAERVEAPRPFLGSLPDLRAGDEVDAPHCVECDYNLTGLTSPRCPECGWYIVWPLTRLSEEDARLGTPVYLATGWDRLLAPWLAVVQMLFRPIMFARRLRHDEPWLPALGVALCAGLLGGAIWWAGHGIHSYDWNWVGVYGASILTCILVNMIGFLAVNTCHGGPQRWRDRLRSFLMLTLYSTCFIAAWAVTRLPLLEGPFDANFFWLGDDPFGHVDELLTDDEFLGRTIIFYWWVTILWVFTFMRTRPRWAALLFVPVPLVAAAAAHCVGAYLVTPTMVFR